MVFSLGCMKKSLLALVAISLLVSIGQLVLIFINNKVFGAFMFIMYILFFLGILLALCRDSVSMYSASLVLLILFVVGCMFIQAYDVEVKDLIKLSKDDDTDEAEETVTEASKEKRDVPYQSLQSEPPWKPQEPDQSWEPPADILPAFPVQPSESLPVEQVEPKENFADPYPFPASGFPSQPPATPMDEYPQVATQWPTEFRTPYKALIPDRRGGGDKSHGDGKYHWRNELRWISNVLGVFHILMITVIVCLLYEMLFGGRYRYRTWC
ncbi:hypothetical protein HHI36_016384 [Cryptolaemus montrouzieri]|uniref:Uncharacterized protein n=1 Tax=Cryptolaemus montrouzieri TaxID=559131 RepID=A0ABD2NK12_9CUCU